MIGFFSISKKYFKQQIRNIWYHFYPWPGLNGLDRKVLPFLPKTPGFFVEAGANDGIRQSNTFYLEKRRSWNGLLVEPIPSLAKRCKKNRKASVVFEGVLVSQEQSGKMVEIIDLDLMSMVTGDFGSKLDQTEHQRLAEKVQGIRGTKHSTLGRSISDLLDELKCPQVDFFSLDVEGFELDVLDGLDIKRHRPSFILVETKDEPLVTAKLHPFYSLVARLSHHDCLYQLMKP